MHIRVVGITSVCELFSRAPLAGPRRKRIGNQPVVTGEVPEVGARRRVILHAADDLFHKGYTRGSYIVYTANRSVAAIISQSNNYMLSFSPGGVMRSDALRPERTAKHRYEKAKAQDAYRQSQQTYI